MAERRYDPQAVEAKWQARWEAGEAFAARAEPGVPAYYVLEMFPYPSGRIHMGHVRNYTIGDVIARQHRMRGERVLHPIGWDAFGLPAENAAIQHGAHPARWTRDNIAHMRRQLRRLGFSYDWDRESSTCDPAYYRWEQVFFLRMRERGLAYRRRALVNWWPRCAPGLPNGHGEDGRCWRCEASVEERELEQWFLRITAYAEELLRDLDRLGGWPERVVTMQRNWIGRSEGAEIRFPLEGAEGEVRVFTTRPDTLFGVTFMSLAVEHPLVERLIAGRPSEAAVRAFVARTRRTPRAERTLGKEGVFTGAYCTHPFTGVRVPIWVANFVLMEYGTGAVMAVPAHDQRDFEFARAYGLPVKVVIQPEGEALAPATLTAAWEGPGRLVESGEFTGLASEEAKGRITAALAARGQGGASVSYRLGGSDPGRVLRPRRRRARARGGATRRAPGGRGHHGQRGLAARRARGVRPHPLPPLRRRGTARDRYHGHLRRVVLVLRALLLAAQRHDAVRAGRGRLLAPRRRRPVHRGHRARGAAPALRALLHQGAARPRLSPPRRAVPRAAHAGHGDQGRGEDEQVEGERRGSGLPGGALRGRHGAALLPLRCAPGKGPRLERSGRGGDEPLPRARLAPGARPRAASCPGRQPARGVPRRPRPAPARPPDDRARDRGGDRATALQHRDRRAHGAGRRPRGRRGDGVGGRGAGSRRRAPAAARAVRAPPRERALGDGRARRGDRGGGMADGRPGGARPGDGRARRAGERQGAGADHGPGRRRRGHGGRGRARRRAGAGSSRGAPAAPPARGARAPREPRRMKGGLLLGMLALAACGYRLAGAGPAVPPDARTIAIRQFTNATQASGIEVEVTRAVEDEFRRRGTLRVGSVRDQPDLERSGGVRSIGSAPVAIGPNGQALQYMGVMRVSVRLVDRRTGKTLFENRALQEQQDFGAVSGVVITTSPGFQRGTLNARDLADLNNVQLSETRRTAAMTSLLDLLAHDIYSQALEGF